MPGLQKVSLIQTSGDSFSCGGCGESYGISETGNLDLRLKHPKTEQLILYSWNATSHWG